MTSPGASRLRPFVLTLAVVIALVPLLSLLLDSFRPPQAFFGSSFFTDEWTTQNYTGAFSSEGGTFTALVNSLIVASATTVISVVLGTLAAFGLGPCPLRLDDPGYVRHFGRQVLPQDHYHPAVLHHGPFIAPALHRYGRHNCSREHHAAVSGPDHDHFLQ